MREGKLFQETHTDKEKVDFLKQEYGIGERSHALSGAIHSDEDHDGKGLHYKKQDCPDVHLSRGKVAKRITGLLTKKPALREQFMDAEEKRLAMLYFCWDEVAPVLRGVCPSAGWL